MENFNEGFMDAVSKITETVKSSRFKVIIEYDNTILIKGIDFNKLYLRMKEYYGDKKPFQMFIPVYHSKDFKRFEAREITRSQMRITEIRIHPFFALEASIIFDDMAKRYNYSFYRKIYDELITKTWLNDAIDNTEYIINTNPLRNIKYRLKNYQLEFIKQYYNIKNKNGLDGYILSFDQGLGKTLTSIALAECLHAKYVYIVCPNSLKENWAYEIKAYFKKYDGNSNLWREEVAVIGNKSFPVTNKTKYFIVNQESINKVFPYTISNRKNMIIVDESHNFRDLHSKRTDLLIQLKKRLKCTDVLMMSGTPIKGSPNEIAPALRMVDPLFNDEVATIYNKCFNVDTSDSKEMIRARLNRVLYRKTKSEVLKLPDKRKHSLRLDVKNAKEFELKTVNGKISDSFNKKYEAALKHDKEYRKEFIDIVNRYSTSTNEEVDRFLSLIDTYVNKDDGMMHELDDKFFNKYTDVYILPNIKDPELYKRTMFLSKKFLNMKKSCMGVAIGEVLPKSRSEMYIQLYEQNKAQFIRMINERTKKTIIFTSMLPVANHIFNDLTQSGVGCVRIVGETTDRMDLIQTFKESDTIDVLIATTQTLSTGVTITEASQMFFFGVPWRSADFEQACDRIHRIGQTDDVDIYTVLLNSKNPNLSDRMDQIMTWSSDMFNNMIEKQDKDY